MKRIAVITSVRNGARFLDRWIAHYGAAFGADNLYVMLDGKDQPMPTGGMAADVNVLRLPFVPRARLAGDKQRAARASDLARVLFSSYDMVIATDVDEFICVDPALGLGLAAYLSALPGTRCRSALGIDVAPNTRTEAALDWSAPFLGQRRFGQLSDRYTKASILSKPLRWGSGQHRVKGHRFHIDPNLFLFHFGSVDHSEIESRADDAERRANGWSAHQARRATVPDLISTAHVVSGDARFETARTELGRPRSLVAWNKPRPLKHDSVIEIPDRFFGLV